MKHADNFISNWENDFHEWRFSETELKQKKKKKKEEEEERKQKFNEKSLTLSLRKKKKEKKRFEVGHYADTTTRWLYPLRKNNPGGERVNVAVEHTAQILDSLR